MRGSILLLLAMTLIASIAESRPRDRLFCEESTLRNGYGEVLRQLTFRSDCQDALQSQRGALLCVRSGIKSDLINTRGRQLISLTFASDCMEAIESRTGRLLCAREGTKSVLLSVAGERIRTFSFESDCKKALKQSRQNDGYAC